MTQGLRYLENLFRELDDDTSLTISISEFFDALSDFANDPTSEGARTMVQQTALSMTDNFKLIRKEMVDLYNDQNSSVKTVATQINQIAKEFAALNGPSPIRVSGETANDLRDKRTCCWTNCPAMRISPFP
jgi:flagellar hook-associated protein 1 FlgK